MWKSGEGRYEPIHWEELHIFLLKPLHHSLCRNNSADSGALTPPFSACNWFVIIEFLGECFVTLRFTWALLLRIEKTIIHWDIGIYGKWWCVCRLVVGSQLHSSTSKIPLYNEITDELSFSHEIHFYEYQWWPAENTPSWKRLIAYVHLQRQKLGKVSITPAMETSR